MEITNELLLERVQHLEMDNFSEKTIKNYFTDVKLFLEFIKYKLSVQTVDTDKIRLIEIDKRKSALAKTMTPKTSIYYAIKPTLSQSTIQWKLTAVKSLLKYLNLYYDEWMDYRKIEIKKYKSDYIEYLTDDEFRTLENFIWSYENYKINALRMQLLCNIAYTSWLRLSEMLSLKVEDIEKKEIRLTGKWDKKRWVFFTDSSLNLLEDYLSERGKPLPWTGKKQSKSDYVFISHNGWYDYWRPVKKNVICDRMKTYSEKLDLGKRITVHSLRHSYATKLLESGMNIREIQELLGHSDITTTQNYCHVLKSGLKNKVMTIFD